MDATFALSLGILNVEVSDAKTKTFNNVFPIKSSIAAATNKDETTMMEKSLSLSLKDSLKGQIPTREWASTEISRGKSSNYFITGQIFYHKNEFVRKKIKFFADNIGRIQKKLWLKVCIFLQKVLSLHQQ